MNKYELITIVDSQKPEDKKETINKQTMDAVTKNGGKIINNKLWLDKHKMSFAIKRCSVGTYYLTNFESATKAIHSIKQILMLNEEILRFAIFKAE